MTAQLDEMGPIDYLCIEFPAGSLTGEAMPRLVDLVDRQIIRIIDLQFVRRGRDGSVVVVDSGELDRAGLGVFRGVASDILGDDDRAEAGEVLQPGSTAAILVYENLWAAPLARALRREGAQLVASGRIPVQALLAALDATESGEAAVAAAGRG